MLSPTVIVMVAIHTLFGMAHAELASNLGLHTPHAQCTTWEKLPHQPQTAPTGPLLFIARPREPA